MLIGGAGRDLLIAAGAADRLSGSGGDDILLGGYPQYDEDPFYGHVHAASEQAIAALLAEWGRTDRTADRRVARLRAGLGADGSARLVTGSRGDGSTV